MKRFISIRLIALMTMIAVPSYGADSIDDIRADRKADIKALEEWNDLMWAKEWPDDHFDKFYEDLCYEVLEDLLAFEQKAKAKDLDFTADPVSVVKREVGSCRSPMAGGYAVTIGYQVMYRYYIRPIRE